MPPSIEFFFLGFPSPARRPFPRSHTSSLWGKLEFLADAPFKSIMLLYPGSSRAILLNLNNLFLAFLFAGFIYLIPYLSADKATVFQPFYSIAFLMEDPRPNYIISFLRSTVLPRSFTPLFGSPSIYGPTPSYRLTPEVIWFFGSIFRHSHYTPIYLPPLVNIFIPYLLPQVPFISPRGFIFINLLIRPPTYAPIGIFGFIGN